MRWRRVLFAAAGALALVLAAREAWAGAHQRHLDSRARDRLAIPPSAVLVETKRWGDVTAARYQLTSVELAAWRIAAFDERSGLCDGQWREGPVDPIVLFKHLNVSDAVSWACVVDRNHQRAPGYEGDIECHGSDAWLAVIERGGAVLVLHARRP